MRTRSSLFSGIALAATMSLAACGGHDNGTTSGGDVATPAASSNVNAPATATTPAPMDTAPTTHHSKLAGAAVGAVAGHMLGGHAVAGAAAGALIQHERNKHH